MIDLTDAWNEWHEQCQLKKCTDENRKNLCIVSNCIFCKILKNQPPLPHLSASKFMSIVNQDPEYSFLLMETYLLPKDEEERRKYKDSKFEGRASGEVTGYFLRSYFRSYVRNLWEKEEKRESQNVHAPNDSDDEDWQEKLVEERGDEPDTSLDPAAQLDEKTAAIAAKNYFFQEITRTDRIALWAYLNRVPMDTPEVLKQAGLKHSAFSARPRKLIENYSETLQRRLEQCHRLKAKDDEIDEEMELKEKVLYMRSFLSEIRYCSIQWAKETKLGQALASDPNIKRIGEKRG